MSQDPAFLINHELRKHGFASLDEAGPLISQLAFCVRDHAHLKALINACSPAERRNMYEALAPNLRFKARPLDSYVSELALDAEIRQLPTIGPGGELVAFKPPPPIYTQRTDDQVASEALNEELAQKRVWVSCVVCTREQTFGGITKEDAVKALRKAGWRMAWKKNEDPAGNISRDRVEVCPNCLWMRSRKRKVAA